MAVNCFRFFGFTSFAEVDNLTPHQYRILTKALRLRQVDDDYNVHWIAYNTFRAQATKKQGKKDVPVYKTFKAFFDYEKELKKAEKELNGPDESRFKDLINYKKRKEGESHG